MYSHEYLFVGFKKKHFFSTYKGIVKFVSWFFESPTDSPVNSRSPYTFTKVPNLESESSTYILLFTSLILAWDLETDISETVISFETLLPTLYSFLKSKLTTWIAFERQLISDSNTIYFELKGTL